MLGYKKVVFAADCIYEKWDTEKECPICPECSCDYAECDCPEYDYYEINGILYAKLIINQP